MRTAKYVIGVGKLGSQIADLLSERKESVVAIDIKEGAFDRLSDIFSGMKLVIDATDVTSLEEAGLPDAQSVVITAGDDNVNLFLCHLCRKIYDIPTVYVRFNSIDMEQCIGGLGVLPIFPLELSKNLFEHMLRGSSK